MTEKFVNPKPKTWWAKRVLSNSYHSAGRLSERQLKYAAEGGFPTIVSLFRYPDERDRSARYDARFDPPSTSQSEYVVSKCDGVAFDVILGDDDGDDWKTQAAVLRVEDVARSRAKPMLLYCDNSYASTFLLLAYYARAASRGEAPDDVPDISDKDVFRIGARLGYDYGGDPALVRLVSELTGGGPLAKRPVPDATVSNWYDLYWPMKPVYKQFFVCGQFQTNDVQKLARVGFQAIVNCRGNKPDPEGDRRAEEVSLLNISGGVDTKGDLSQFLPKRINQRRPKSYIAKRSPINYEFINPLEFGDADGYNDETERRHVTKFMFSARYVHIPIDLKTGFTMDTWKKYKDFKDKQPDTGPVLIHCRTGFRAGRLCFLAAAHAHGLSSKWALERALLIGYDLGNESYNKMLEDVLNHDKSESAELQGR